VSAGFGDGWCIDKISTTAKRFVRAIPSSLTGRMLNSLHEQQRLIKGAHRGSMLRSVEASSPSALLDMLAPQSWDSFILAEESMNSTQVQGSATLANTLDLGPMQPASALQALIDQSPAILWRARPDGSIDFLNRRFYDYTGQSSKEADGWDWQVIIHPEDLAQARKLWREVLASGQPGEMEVRMRRFDGVYRWFLIRTVPTRDGKGSIIGWFGSNTDIEDRKQAEEKLRDDERELRGMVDAIPHVIHVFDADGSFLYANRPVLEYTGLSADDVRKPDFRARVFHPEDMDSTRDVREKALIRGAPFEFEMRARRSDGQYRWFLIRYNPLRDEQGRIIRWYATGMDVEDRKREEERTRNENFALREDIIRTSMCEEIIGSSVALRRTLAQVAKVAPSDSTVLILGETGTGKELIARAIHRLSNRSARAFIKVNCAAIPASLIASELFGYEKGAFTGAVQRRIGRFESADGGTIFLDEIGDLPAETLSKWNLNDYSCVHRLRMQATAMLYSLTLMRLNCQLSKSLKVECSFRNGRAR
jgi:formate hydrogenlyase transcriptional activator